jgi:hypothetical protein
LTPIGNTNSNCETGEFFVIKSKFMNRHVLRPNKLDVPSTPRMPPHAVKVLKGLHHDFHRKIKKDNSQKYYKILPKLRGYNNNSHHIAFKMEETQVNSFAHKRKPQGVC